MSKKEEVPSKIFEDWDNFFMSISYFCAMKSKDRSSKVGAVIIGEDNQIVSIGYNGMPRGVDDDKEDRHVKPEKYYWFEHAERNAIYNAAAIGSVLKGCTIYTSLFPCCDCTRGIIQSRMKEIVVPHNVLESTNWDEHVKRSKIMFKEAGIKVRQYDIKKSKEIIKEISGFCNGERTF